MAKLSKGKIGFIVVASLLGVNLVATGVLIGNQVNLNNQINSLKKEEMTKYTLYIGTNDKDTYQPVMEFDACLAKVTEICTKYTDGCTIFEANGYWKDDTGAITKERTIGCILEDITIEKVHSICDETIIALNQNSILIETSGITTTFYSGNK